ncbi:carboxypeptidase-like regulatory domain-containing protein [Marinimicrobium alkaliphilum]|uniref:carboxypeptidase-like regulatory domain-containing protein n=1 Tax=Marinimicrobium alkaliphilum TaxID=2202654 RepID=UPI0013006136|nr:carboxypeptidase-like regulatory domain-containing protein [Marinimicrobium alkaliphilum]
MRALLFSLLTVTLLCACGGSSSDVPNDDNPTGSSSSSSSSVGGDYAPQPVPVEHVTLIDAIGQPLAGFSVSIESDANGANSTVSLQSTGGTPTDGIGGLEVGSLAPGDYQVQLHMDDGEIVHTSLKIQDESASPAVTVAMPVVQDEDDELQFIGDEGMVAALNGIVFNSNGPIEGVEVSLSAGEASNGAIATAVTNAEGEFVLVINVGAVLVPALAEAQIRIVHEDHAPLMVTGVDIRSGGALSGFNQQLTTGQLHQGELVYGDDFSQVVDGATCGRWVSRPLVHPLVGGEPGPSLWQRHTIGRAIRNEALVHELVTLAPDDHSDGYVPDPATVAACWYGVSEPGLSRGNFMINPVGGDDYALDSLDGGTSMEPNAGALESPLIDLSNESAPLALSFRTWWEIESVNPNENGFDLLAIEYRDASEENWRTLARLNPMSDPVSVTNRAPIPFTNRGYNQAPQWLWQEPVSLDDLAGKEVYLRFAFYTVDELYNGFRGWLIDDVRITRESGSFPLWSGSDDYDYGGDAGELTVTEVMPEPVTEIDGMTLPYGTLPPGGEQVFSAVVSYSGTEPDVQLGMSYMDPFDMAGAEELVSLPVGQLEGELVSDAVHIDADMSQLMIQVWVKNADGHIMRNEIFHYQIVDPEDL